MYNSAQLFYKKIIKINMIEFIIYDKVGECKFYYNATGEEKIEKEQERQKSMAGLIFSLISFSKELSKNAPVEEGEKDMDQILALQARKEFKSFTTGLYKTHLYDSPTGTKFVLVTSKTTKEYTALLKEIYCTLYVKLVCMNYLHKPGSGITSEYFKERIKEIIQKA